MEEKLQEAMEKYEEEFIREALEKVNPIFIEVIEHVFTEEDLFVELLCRIHRLVERNQDPFNDREWMDHAHDLRAWLRRKIADYARRKAEQEVPNRYWRNVNEQ